MKNILDAEEVEFSNDEEGAEIGAEEYKARLLPCAALFYDREEYFPVVNIFSYFDLREKAAEALFKGVKTNALKGNFRNVSRLAALARSENILSRDEMINLYQTALSQRHILEPQRNANPDLGIHGISYLQNVYGIQQDCLDSNTRTDARIQAVLLSEIDAGADDEIRNEFEMIENAVESLGHPFHTTSIQHNSDLTIIVQIVLQPDVIQSTLDMIRESLCQLGYGIAANAIWDAVNWGLSHSIAPAGFLLMRKGKKKASDGKHAK